MILKQLREWSSERLSNLPKAKQLIRGGLEFEMRSALTHPSILPSVGSVQGCLNVWRRTGVRGPLSELEGGGVGLHYLQEALSVSSYQGESGCLLPFRLQEAPSPSISFHHPVLSRCSSSFQTHRASQLRREQRACNTFAPSRRGLGQ